MKRVAIIPARGGSKRIPRKNIKLFHGKPIIAYSIEAALNSGLFQEVMVSTDDDEIAEIAKNYGANVPFLRSSKNADDHATTFDVIEEVIEQYASRGKNFEFGCCIYPSAPFTTTERIKKFMAELEDSEFDCLFPVLQYSYPIQRALTLSENNNVSMLNPDHLTTRSQDLQSSYHDAGQFYCFRVERLMIERKLWTNNTGGILIEEMTAQDIDNLDDWQLAEFKYQYLEQKNMLK